MIKKILSPEQALQKLKHYCAYQERCHKEVREKLYQLGLSGKYHDDIVAVLIEENYLNEERFALAVAGGRFRMNKWGRLKIKQILKQKQVSEYCINKALKGIDDNAYRKTLEKLAEKKYITLKDESNYIRKKKTMDYLTGKGFEGGLVREVVDKI